jgi:uncharacterized protein (TIGR03083 family)
MTNTALPAFQQLTQTIRALELTDEQWRLPSACPGWSNHDILIHLTCTLREVADPNSLPAPVPGSIERSNDVGVAAFRSQTPSETLADYTTLVRPTIDGLQAMQQEPTATETVDFDDAGVYATHLIADSLVFDHYTHLRHDMLQPRGQLQGIDAPQMAEVMASSLTWLMADLPQMSPKRLAPALVAPVDLKLTGPGGGSWTLVSDGRSVSVAPTRTPSKVQVSSSASDFHLWGTRRISWRDLNIEMSGDTGTAREVLDAIHVF